MFDINVQKNNDEIRVKFSKNLHVSNSLKQKLKKPIYHPDHQYWTISADQEAAVIAWVKWMQKELILIESRELNRKNEEILQEIKIELKLDQEMRDEIETIKARTAVLEANQAELAKVKLQVVDTETQLQAARSEMTQLIEQMIDLGKLKEIAKIMSNNMNYQIKGAREKFELAQKEAIDLRRIVTEAGYRFDALDRIAGASYNRPDRDNPKNIPEQAWYNIRKLAGQ